MNIRALAGKIGLDYEKTIEDFCGDVSALGAKLSSDFAKGIKATPRA